MANQVLGVASIPATPQKICPTDELKKLHGSSLDKIEAYLLGGTDDRFGPFVPLDPALDPENNIAKKDNGWRLFQSTKVLPDSEGKLCHKTIMLKSVINALMSLPEVQAICNVKLASTDGAFDKVLVEETKSAKNAEQKILLQRVNHFVSSYLNKYAERASMPKGAAVVTGGC